MPNAGWPRPTCAEIKTRNASAEKVPDQREPAASPPQPILAAHRDASPAAGEAAGGQSEPKDCESALANPTGRSASTFREPVQGVIVGKFGSKDDGPVNDGIDFSVPKGTPVKAAENGVVAYVGNELPGFGNLILVRHADGYVTAYAHNDELLVRRCDLVKRGEVIAKAGATGKVTEPAAPFRAAQGLQADRSGRPFSLGPDLPRVLTAPRRHPPAAGALPFERF